MSLSNTYKLHINKLNKKIDSKLFDLLVDLEDQNANGYDHNKTNYELIKIIFQKIILDKNMNIHAYPKGVYEYKSGTKHEYTSYELTIGKDKDNSIQLVTSTAFSKQKTKPSYKDYDAKNIVKKYKIDLVNLFRTQSYYYKCKNIHVDTITINQEYVRVNNKLSNVSIPIKCGQKLPDQKFNDEMTKLNTIMNNNYKKLINNKNIQDINKLIVNDPNNINGNKYNNDNIENNNIENPYNKIKNYNFNIQNKDMSEEESEEEEVSNNNINPYLTQQNIETEIEFYENKLGIVSNTHKNRDRFKYLQKLAKKYSKNHEYNEKFANYYNYTKSINFNDI